MKNIKLFVFLSLLVSSHLFSYDNCCNPCAYNCCEPYYVSISGGANWGFKQRHDTDAGWYAGIAIGKYICEDMRFELAFDYLRNEVDDPSDGRQEVYAFLANAYKEFCSWGCVTPYAGLGVGYVHLDTKEYSDVETDRVAAQAITGIKYKINECYSATLSTRVLAHTMDGTFYHALLGVSLMRSF